MEISDCSFCVILIFEVYCIYILGIFVQCFHFMLKQINQNISS